MGLVSLALRWLFKLPPATHRVKTTDAIPIPMRDGVTLRADHHVPVGLEKAPLVLVRTPYGAAGPIGWIAAKLIAERGFQVLVVEVRGTFRSEGDFFPFQQEKADGADVLAWMKAQPWYPGSFATNGPSYLGLTQWAIAASAGPDLKGLAIQISASSFRGQTYAGESFALENALSWADLITSQPRPLLARLFHTVYHPQLSAGLKHLPLETADQVAVGKTVPFYQNWLRHNQAGDPWWSDADHSGSLGDIDVPIQISTGWHDLFLPWTLEDYARLKAAGRPPSLMIGPWAHADVPGIGAGIRNAIPFLRQVLGAGPKPETAPVRIFVGGLRQWRDLSEWPPPSTATRWNLQTDRGFAPKPPSGGSDHYLYDPEHPTPSVGGPQLANETSGPKDQRRLEARPDVLVYTSAPLTEDLEVIGTIEAELFVQSSLEHTDFFARLCDVSPDGKSVNICDALIRLTPGSAEKRDDGTLKVRFPLWPTAHRFLTGHRLRAQISSGAHPRYARNLGTGEPLATATEMSVAEQTVFHEAGKESALILPITNGR